MDDNMTKPVREASEKGSRTCYECGKQTRRIYDHLFQAHSYTKDRLEQLNKEDRIRQLADKTNVAYVRDCGNSYPNVKSLKRHHVQKHESEIASYVLCPLCGEHLRDHWKLIDHANCEHIDSEEIYSIEAMTFDSIEKFKVTDTGCEVNLKFCRRHLGHDEEPAKLTLDARSEEYIVSLLKEGFRPHQIIRKIRDNYRDNKNSWLYYSSVSDIRRVAIRNKVNPARRNNVDITSVEMRVQENAVDDGIRLYVPAVENTGEGFVLVIITTIQKAWLERYGARAIIMDDTFNLTTYCLKLATVVVADEWDKGLPAAYLLSHQFVPYHLEYTKILCFFIMTEDEIALLFDEIRKLIGSFGTKHFMRDDCNSFFNGFKKIFLATKTKKLLCLFHVLQSIKRNCKTKLKQKERTNVVISTVRKLCRISSANEFATVHSNLITFLNQHNETNMADYFEANWSPRVKQWAGFERRTSCVNTSMLVERFHKRIKHEIPDTKGEALIELLITLVPLMEEDRSIKGLAEGRHSLHHQHRPHALALKLFGHDSEAVMVVEEGRWALKDKKGVHTVKQTYCICEPTMNNHCLRCQACAYAFMCDCVHDATSGISCAHVHAAIVQKPEGLLAEMVEDLPVAAEVEVNGAEDYALACPEDSIRDPSSDLKLPSSSTEIVDDNKKLLVESESIMAAIGTQLVNMSKMPHNGSYERFRGDTRKGPYA